MVLWCKQCRGYKGMTIYIILLVGYCRVFIIVRISLCSHDIYISILMINIIIMV